MLTLMAMFWVGGSLIITAFAWGLSVYGYVWRYLAPVALSLEIVSLITRFYVGETPKFLARVGNYEQLRSTLRHISELNNYQGTEALKIYETIEDSTDAENHNLIP
jgi:hypothetical protein